MERVSDRTLHRLTRDDQCYLLVSHRDDRGLSDDTGQCEESTARGLAQQLMTQYLRLEPSDDDRQVDGKVDGPALNRAYKYSERLCSRVENGQISQPISTVSHPRTPF